MCLSQLQHFVTVLYKTKTVVVETSYKLANSLGYVIAMSTIRHSESAVATSLYQITCREVA